MRLGYGLAFFNLFNTQLIPFYVLFLLRAFRNQAWRDAIIAGVILGLNAYIDFQIAAFLILFSGLYALYNFLEELQRSNHKDTKTQRIVMDVLRALVPLWFVVGLVSFIVATPILVIVANDFAAEGGNYIRVFPIKYSTERSYDLVSYIAPNAWSSLYSIVPKIPGVNAGVDANDGSALSPDRQPFVGYIVLVLAVCATVTQWKRARFWSIAAILFAVLSWGPSLHILGREVGMPLPYLVLHEIPIVNHIRIPMRYGIMVMFALAILTALSIEGLRRRAASSQLKIPKPLFSLGLLLIPMSILLEYTNLPYPIQPLTIPHIYSNLARVPGDFTVLEIPSFNWRFAATTEAYQAIHGKRILRAYTNRIAPDLAEYSGLRGTPIVVRSLRILEGVEQGVLTLGEIAEDKRARDDVVRFFDLRYAVVHRQSLKPEQARDIDAYLRDVLNAHVISDEGDTVAYEIPGAPPASGTLKIDLRENIAQMYAGRGWHFQSPPANFDNSFNFVWESGAESEIYFVGEDSSDRTMTIHAYTELPEHVVVLLNGEQIGRLDLTKEWKDYRVTLPGRALQSGMNRIELKYSEELTDIIGVTTITIE